MQDIVLVTESTRWQVFLEVMGSEGVLAKELYEVCRRDPRFRGKVPAAYDHGKKLARARLVTPTKWEGNVAYVPSPKGEFLWQHLEALAAGPGADEVRSKAETRVLALVARLVDEDFDLINLRPGEEAEIVTTLRRRTRDATAAVQRLSVTRSDEQPHE